MLSKHEYPLKTEESTFEHKKLGGGSEDCCGYTIFLISYHSVGVLLNGKSEEAICSKQREFLTFSVLHSSTHHNNHDLF